MSNNSSNHSIRADRVHFIHQNDHAGADVAFNTSGDFDFVKAVKSRDGVVVNDKFKLKESSNVLYIQKNTGTAAVPVWTNYLSLA